MKKITSVLTIGALALALAACGSSSNKSSSSASTSSASSSGGGYGSGSAKKKNTSVSSTSSGSAVSIDMIDNSFSTKTITGKPGSTVKVKLTNKGQNKHNFKIDGQKAADADVDPGTT